MARRRRRLRVRRRDGEDLAQFEISPTTKRGILIVIFLVLSVLTFLAFFELAGAAGQIIIKTMGLLFGWAAVASPLVFLAVAAALFLAGRQAQREEDEAEEVSNLRVYIGAILLVFALPGVLHLIALHRTGTISAFTLVKQGNGGGYFGALAALPLLSLVDFWPALAILLALLVISFLVMFNFDLVGLFRRSRDMARQRAQNRQRQPVSAEIKINKMETSGFNVSKVSQVAPPLPLEERKAILTSSSSISGTETGGEKEGVGITLANKYKKGNWQLPSLDLLEDTHTAVDSGDIEANVSIIQKTLADFGIEVEMGEVNVGPTVTQYTLRPAQGIKLSQIAALQNDLALALAAPSIRMELPIPGRSLVGIEIPNKASAIVRIKDIISTEEFVQAKSGLAFALGRDVAGRPMMADLARMPHLLIAGATGTGKSVAINSLLISLLYRDSPEELRLIVIDPKRVELNLYNGIPHLMTPVVTDHDKAVNALKWAVNEMDRRYSLFAEAGKRNILEYNLNLPAGRQELRDRLPYIVVIVDELADLMAVAQADVEAAIVRLAQMARAVGVHLVVATQRPSVDIITGLIKANITARMAFAVASQVDSRTILDSSGAEKLLGAGDMLYITSDLGKPRRIQGTYISEKEVKNVVEFVSNQAGEVDYDTEILEKQRPSAPGGGGSVFGVEGDLDDMLPEAIAVVKAAGKASASLLQRRLRIGYARAARLLDLMEEQGIIGPGDGAKPRDVYGVEGQDYNDESY